MTRTLLVLGFMVWGLSVIYAWRDWYKALCGLIVFAALSQHPDMPRTILGVPGLNLWNSLFFIVLLAWMFQRGSERLRWDMPRAPGFLLLLGLGVVVVGFVRLVVDRDSLVEDLTISGLISEYLINTLKWVIVGLLLFDGCRDHRRLMRGLVSILLFYVVISLQVLRAVLPGISTDGDSLSKHAMMEVATSVGYHRNDVSVMLAGAFWALIAMQSIAMPVKHRVAMVLGTLTVLFAQVITLGRGGYLAWCVVGLTLGVVRWRRCLLLGPLIAVALLTFLSPVTDRVLVGFSGKAGITLEEADIVAVTAGRTIIWSLIIDKIWDAPLVGHGRAAMQRTGVSDTLLRDELFEDLIGHPHNAYLEMLLEGGLIGLLVTLALYGTFVVAALSLLRDARSDEYVAVGGVALSLVLAQLVGSVSGQSFWPREPTFGTWCAIGLVLRVWTQCSQATAGADARDVPEPVWWKRPESPGGNPPAPTCPGLARGIRTAVPAGTVVARVREGAEGVPWVAGSLRSGLGRRGA